MIGKKSFIPIIYIFASVTAFASEGTHYSLSGFYWRIFIFALFVALLIKLLRKRIRDGVATSIDKTVAAITEAEKACSASEHALADYSKKISGMSAELENMKQIARESIKKEADMMIANAEKAAQEQLKNASKTIKSDTERAKLEIHNEIVAMALEKAEEIILKESNIAEKQKYITDNIPNIGASR